MLACPGDASMPWHGLGMTALGSLGLSFLVGKSGCRGLRQGLLKESPEPGRAPQAEAGAADGREWGARLVPAECPEHP